MPNSRIRMFAGPNGSGKSTLIQSLKEIFSIGIYINADEIEKEIKSLKKISLKKFQMEISSSELHDEILKTDIFNSNQKGIFIKKISLKNNQLGFSKVNIDSYLSSFIAGLIRKKLIESHISFSFETVMSHKSKLDLFVTAKKNSYRNYLYFITTDNPYLNVERVKQRVEAGGHNVGEEKTISRYKRSLNLLLPAVRLTDRAYLFDNSGEQHQLICEVTNGKSVELKVDENVLPDWFKKYFINKLK